MVYPVGVHLILTPFIVVLVNVFCTLKNLLGFLRFLNLENFLSPEGRYWVYPVGVQLILFPFIVLGNVYWTFKTYLLERPFLNLANVLFDGVGLGGVGSDGPSKGSFNFFHFKIY